MPEPGVLVLIALTALFFARVLGQALVAFTGVAWLPPMEAWYSGLLPYPVLLPVQILILLLQVKLDIDAARATGLLARPRPALGGALRAVSYVYAVAMIVRYVVTRTHAIPVVFHLVLVAYLFVLGWLASGARMPRARPSILAVALCAWATTGRCAVASDVACTGAQRAGARAARLLSRARPTASRRRRA